MYTPNNLNNLLNQAYLVVYKEDDATLIEAWGYNMNRDFDIKSDPNTSIASADSSSNSLPTVFISFNKESKETANRIYDRLSGVAKPRMYSFDLKSWGSLTKFMKSIRKDDFAVFVISDKFLKSEGCLYEVSQLMKDEDWIKKSMFVVEDSAKGVYEYPKRVNYMRYWNKCQIAADEIPPDLPLSLIDTSNAERIKEIVGSIKDFLNAVNDAKNPSVEKAIGEIVERASSHNATKDDAVASAGTHSTKRHISIIVSCDGDKFFLDERTIEELENLEVELSSTTSDSPLAVEVDALRFVNWDKIAELFLKTGYKSEVRLIQPFDKLEAAKQEIAHIRTIWEDRIKYALEFAFNDEYFDSLLAFIHPENDYMNSPEWNTQYYQNSYGARIPYTKTFAWCQMLNRYLLNLTNPSDAYCGNGTRIDCVCYKPNGEAYEKLWDFFTEIHLDENDEAQARLKEILNNHIPRRADIFDLPKDCLLIPVYADMCFEIARRRCTDSIVYESLLTDYGPNCFNWRRLEIGLH